MQSTKVRNAPESAIVRYIGLTAFLAVLLGLIVHFVVRYLGYAYEALHYPFSLDYGEGIVWQQALLIPGERMYTSINNYPFIVFHYPPVYHLVVRAVASLGPDDLTAGRALSLVSTLAIAVMISLFTLRATKQTVGSLAYIAAAIAGLTIFTCLPVFQWSLVMRVDMLAIALSFLGVYLAAVSMDRPSLLYWASLAFVLALYTKQTSIAAPLSTLAIMLAVKPKQALWATGLAALLGATLFVLLCWKTDGGFARHILLYNINRFDVWHGIRLAYNVFRRHGFYLLVVAVFLVSTWWPLLKLRSRAGSLDRLRTRLTNDRWFFGLSLFTIYLLATTAMLATAAKLGSWHNYFIEWICVWCVVLGMAVAATLSAVWPAGSRASRPLRLSLGIGLPVALMCQIWLPGPWAWAGLPSTAETESAQIVLERIQAAKKPVLSDEMGLLVRAGKEVPIEPAIFRELAYKGLWNEERIIHLIESRFFEFVVIAFPRSDQLWTPEVRSAIEAAYPRVVEYSRYSIYLPRNSTGR